MAAPATPVMFREADGKERKRASHPVPVCEVASGGKEDGDDEEMRRLLFERFMASCGPGTPCLCEAPKVHTQPCVLYTMRISIKKKQVSWSRRSSRRFLPERRGSTFPIPICRVVAPDHQVEQVVDRSGAPVEPARPGILSGIFEGAYYAIEHSREKRVIQREGFLAPLREVAVIRGMPGGRGITSFRLPSGWKEERLYSEDGFHFVDIAAPVENLVRKLDMMRQQEDNETEEDREKRLLQEEAMRKQDEEERKRICAWKEEERRIREEEEAAKPPVYADPIWDAALWEINAAWRAKAQWHCYSKFKLTMNNSKKVYCKCIEQKGLNDMRRRVEDGEFVLPILIPAPLSASSKAFETVGFVEGYFDLETGGHGTERGRFMDQSGRKLSSVLMVSRSTSKILTIKVLVHKLGILLDDGMVLSAGYGFSVDIHCDDISSSEILTTDWRHHILCKNIGCEGIVPFSSLLVQLKRKLNLKLRKEELGLCIMCAIDDEDENKEVTQQHQLPKQQEWVRDKPKHELVEVELWDCSLLFHP
ncbi:hypothetical protein HU200_035584 [Digitaria exilis]|uniref:Uncharacterized protein n=1 Tax=Digitaria exilis TaxID=1010633 RepID=A0A835ELS6_9POAL|nr:hypothetical protein HU200_035584 [Digitaria exilis]